MKRATYPEDKLEGKLVRFSNHTEVIITKGLNNLRNKEECQFHRMLSQHSMSILNDQGITVESSFEKRISNDRRNRSPKDEMLVEVSGYPCGVLGFLTFKSLRTLESNRSPSKNGRASGTSRTSTVLDLTSFPTS